MKTLGFDFSVFKQAGEFFLNELVSDLEYLAIPVTNLESDHLCYRVATLEEYEFYKANLSNHAVLLTEANVNGRPICTFLLSQPFQTQHHTVKLVELPAPKPGVQYHSGFEHAEFVIRECFENFSARFPHLTFHQTGNTTTNPELCLKLNDRQAKFHHLSLERIIEIEKADIQDIIFDFDGTLIKSREKIHEINRIVFSKALEREISLQEVTEKFHPEFSRLFEAFEISCPVKRSHAISNWGSVSDGFSYELFEGVIELLQGLREQGFRLHLWTARDERSARKILKDHNIEHEFSTLSFATDVDSKPHANSLRFNWG